MEDLMMLNDILIFYLIFCPWESSITPSERTIQLFPHLKAFNHHAEIWYWGDPYGQDFCTEILWTRRNIRLLWTSPKLAEAERFPPHSVCVKHLDSNCKFQSFLQSRIWVQLHRFDEFEELLQETKALHEVWECAVKATELEGRWAARREALAKLKQILGPIDFYSGKLPPSVPVQKMYQVD